MPFAATWVDLEISILSKVSQTERDKYHMISLICGIMFFFFKIQMGISLVAQWLRFSLPVREMWV